MGLDSGGWKMWQRVRVTRHYLPQVFSITPWTIQDVNRGRRIWERTSCSREPHFLGYLLCVTEDSPLPFRAAFSRGGDTLTTGFTRILDESDGRSTEVWKLWNRRTERSLFLICFVLWYHIFQSWTDISVGQYYQPILAYNIHIDKGMYV